jgi:hypothetical protein
LLLSGLVGSLVVANDKAKDSKAYHIKVNNSKANAKHIKANDANCDA